MTFDDIDLAEFPSSFTFARLVESEFMRWEAYVPTTIEADVPFNMDWWKYVYWVPRIKRELYTSAIGSQDIEMTVAVMCLKYGMNMTFFEKNYKFLVKRMHWMKKNNKFNHINELP